MKHIETSSARASSEVERRNPAARGVESSTVPGIKGVVRLESHTEFRRRGGYSLNVLPRVRRWIATLTSLWDLSVRLAEGRLRRLVTKALALKPRGFAPKDVLALTELSGQLQLEWRARDIHPWDRDQPPARQAELFREQALHDTDDAVVRLFQLLPEIDALGIRVLAPRDTRLMLAGTVSRREAFATRSLSSPGMRLTLMGVRYHVTEGHLEPLE